MLATGVTAFRLNTSHLQINEILTWLEQLSSFIQENSPELPIILDMQGSKWRIGQIESRTLGKDEQLELVCAAASQSRSRLPVPHPDFFAAALQSSPQILLNDAKVILRREAAGTDWLRARVLQGGEISTRKGITYAQSGYRNESLTDKDREILASVRGNSQIRFALSYVRDSLEMLRYREHYGATASLIAKIERQTALDDAAEICNSADELWLCRGDLGAELGLRAMGQAVHRFNGQVASFSRPVLMAGQVLEHMSQDQQPTRSEVCHLVDCLQAGYQGFVLSDETAIGKYPVESCQIAGLFQKDD